MTRVARGAAWGLAGQAVTVTASLVATPFVIRGLGPDAYGVLALINVLVGYLGFTDAGIAQGSTKFGTEAHARGDEREESAVVWTCLAVVLACSLAAAAVLIVAARPVVAQVLRLPPQLQDAATLALQIAGLGLIFRNTAAVLNTPQLARLRFDLFTLIESGTSLGRIVLVPAAVAAGFGLTGAVAVAVASSGLAALAHAVAARRLLATFRVPRVQRNLLGPLVRFGAPLVVSTFALAALQHSEKVLLVRFGSVRELAYYSVAFSLAGLVIMMAGQIVQSLFPAFTHLNTEEDRSQLTRLYRRALRGALILFAPIAVVLCVIAEPFFRIWAGEEFGARSAGPFYVLAAGLVIYALAGIPKQVLKAFGRTDLIARFHVAELFPFLVCAAILTHRLGAVGAALAWSIRVVGDAALLFLGAKHVAGLKFAPAAGAALRATAPAVLLALPVVMLALPAPQALRLPVAAMSVAAYALVTWRLVLSEDERGWLVGILSPARRLLPKGA
jgi:O-antigen/teichoic acid export membrane protein